MTLTRANEEKCLGEDSHWALNDEVTPFHQGTNLHQGTILHNLQSFTEVMTRVDQSWLDFKGKTFIIKLWKRETEGDS